MLSVAGSWPDGESARIAGRIILWRPLAGLDILRDLPGFSLVLLYTNNIKATGNLQLKPRRREAVSTVGRLNTLSARRREDVELSVELKYITRRDSAVSFASSATQTSIKTNTSIKHSIIAKSKPQRCLPINFPPLAWLLPGTLTKARLSLHLIHRSPHSFHSGLTAAPSLASIRESRSRSITARCLRRCPTQSLAAHHQDWCSAPQTLHQTQRFRCIERSVWTTVPSSLARLC